MSLDLELIEEIATELGVEPAFVEKDWYAVQALKAISEFSHDKVQIVFAGGTSLSKGYGLLQRFSEDLDFRCKYLVDDSQNQLRKIKSDFRVKLMNKLNKVDWIDLAEDSVKSDSFGIKFPISYPIECEEHTSLRAQLLIEFSFTQPRLNSNIKSISSFANQLAQEGPELEIQCISTVETAADKFCALSWRMVHRNREDESDDPAMIRHLHDLCALKAEITSNSDVFVSTAKASFDGDKKIDKRNTNASLAESSKEALSKLNDDELYRQEYSQFVDAMSYASDEDAISFDDAVAHFEICINLFGSQI